MTRYMNTKIFHPYGIAEKPIKMTWVLVWLYRSPEYASWQRVIWIHQSKHVLIISLATNWGKNMYKAMQIWHLCWK